MMNAEGQKCPTSDEEYDENTLGEVEAKMCVHTGYK
jgi:hypothetical protein